MIELEARDVSFIRAGRAILHDISLRFTQGRHYCLVGPNGSGKTTLLSLLAGQEWPSRGTVTLRDDDTTLPTALARPRFGFFFPRSVATLEAYHPEISALEVISTGLQHTMGVYALPTRDQSERARQLFHRHIRSVPETAPFFTMSTGERFRVLLLRSIIDGPDVLILDEPFDGLDLPGRSSFEELIEQTVRTDARLSLSVLHRIDEIPPFVTDVILLKGGRILAAGSAEEILTGERLSALFDMKLICRRHGSRYYVLHGD